MPFEGNPAGFADYHAALQLSQVPTFVVMRNGREGKIIDVEIEDEVPMIFLDDGNDEPEKLSDVRKFKRPPNG
jgi:hypothetical protein